MATAAAGGPVVHDAVLQSNGDILVAGDFSVGGTLFSLARFLPNGTLDTTFGSGGFAATRFSPGVAGSFVAVLVQPDGKILAVGEGTTATLSELFLARYLG